MAIPVFRRFLLSGLLFGPALANGGEVSADGSNAPTSAASVHFELLYISAFSHYQYFRDQPLLSWKETNDNVGKIGGWRFYTREAAEPDTKATADEARPGDNKRQPSGVIEKSGQVPEDGRKP